MITYTYGPCLVHLYLQYRPYTCQTVVTIKVKCCPVHVLSAVITDKVLRAVRMTSNQ
jgi:hypothetical protein